MAISVLVLAADMGLMAGTQASAIASSVFHCDGVKGSSTGNGGRGVALGETGSVGRPDMIKRVEDGETDEAVAQGGWRCRNDGLKAFLYSPTGPRSTLPRMRWAVVTVGVWNTAGGTGRLASLGTAE